MSFIIQKFERGQWIYWDTCTSEKTAEKTKKFLESRGHKVQIINP